MTVCNTTLEYSLIAEAPLWKGFAIHHFALLWLAIAALLSITISLWLMIAHTSCYTTPSEQRHAVRILFVVPVYTILSSAGAVFFTHALYYEIAWNIYEAFVIASFFTLCNSYIAPTLREQKQFYRTLKPKAWPWPLSWVKPCVGKEKGFLRTPTNGLAWANTLWIGIFQYCLMKVVLSVASVIAQSFNRYCEVSVSPMFGHIWILCLEAVSVTIAKYCLLAHWHTLKDELKKVHRRARLQLVCIMLVVYLTFWQNLLISLLTSQSGPLQPTKHISYQDLKVTLPIAVLNLEMFVYSIMHIFAYNPRAYDPARGNGDRDVAGRGTKKLGFFAAMWDIWNLWDIVRAIGRSLRLMWLGREAWSDDATDLKESPEDSDVELLAADGTKRVSRPSLRSYQSQDERSFLSDRLPVDGDGQHGDRDASTARLIQPPLPRPDNAACRPGSYHATT